MLLRKRSVVKTFPEWPVTEEKKFYHLVTRISDIETIEVEGLIEEVNIDMLQNIIESEDEVHLPVVLLNDMRFCIFTAFIKYIIWNRAPSATRWSYQSQV